MTVKICIIYGQNVDKWTSVGHQAP